MEQVDIAILGAGAAGLFCAGSAVGQGRRVVVLDHARKPGEKIRISGGGRCNFTNLATAPDRFLSDNPRFAASALSRFGPRDFVALVDRAGIAWHEKTQGQLFCDGRSTQIIDMLLHRMRGAELRLETAVSGVTRQADGFVVQTGRGALRAARVIVATGGKSIPKMGASGIAYDIARDFGLRLVPPRAGLVPLTFAEQDLVLCRPLAGISVEATVACGKTTFRDALLFTHRGLSGPAILQISSYWQPGQTLLVDLCPDTNVAAQLKETLRTGRTGHASHGAWSAVAGPSGTGHCKRTGPGGGAGGRSAKRHSGFRGGAGEPLAGPASGQRGISDGRGYGGRRGYPRP